MKHLENILTNFTKMVSSNFCHDLAKRLGFIQRSTSRLHGHEFAQAMMIPNGFLEAETLNSLCVRMQKINPACNISASGLAQRINTQAAKEFMKACFGKMLKEVCQNKSEIALDLPNLSRFKRVIIEDSTKAQLHEKLSCCFKGCGGVASEAELKINFVFDYVSEEFLDFKFCPGNVPDQALSSGILDLLEKDDLLIRDLGYYVLARFGEIERKLAYYISRFKTNELVFESAHSKTPLDLAKFIDQKSVQGELDTFVFLGKERLRVRLIAYRMTDEVVNQRLRKANRAANRRGNQVSKKKLSLLKYAIFITNIPEEVLAGTSVAAIYRCRWRIELIFKQWKSCLKIHFFKGYNEERLHCFLYGRLIMVLLLGGMTSCLMVIAQKMGKELSPFKLTNYVIADHVFAMAIQEGRINEFVDEVSQALSRRLCCDKRRRHSLRINVRLEKSYYNNAGQNETIHQMSA